MTLPTTPLRQLGWRALALTAVLMPSTASGAPDALTRAELAAVETRLAPVVDGPADNLTLSFGDTVFVRTHFTVRRSLKAETAYEAVMSRVRVVGSPVLHKRADSFRFRRAASGATEVEVIYAVSVARDARRGGSIAAELELRELSGLGNAVAQVPISHRVSLVPPSPSTEALAADFLGYRFFMRRARARLEQLGRVGVRRLDIQDESPISVPPRLSAKGVALLEGFAADRRRAWIAHRHLLAASETKEAGATATAFLKNLARPQESWSGLPPLNLPGMRPTREPEPEPEPEGPAMSEVDESGALAPVNEYVAGSEGSSTEPVAQPREEVPEPTPEPVPEIAVPEAPKEPRPPGPSEAELLAISEGMVEVPRDPDAPMRRGYRYYLPSYGQGLVLDDPDVSFSGGVRSIYGAVSSPEPASVLALFYFAQAALTPDLGIELSVPTALVAVDIGAQEESAYRFGNPLLTAKYRLHLPRVGRRKPSLSIRARWGIAATQRNAIPTTDYYTEQFSQPVTYADTYAFFAEKSDLGLGATFAWQHDWFRLGAQLYLDYFFPSGIATERSEVLAISYGLSAGVMPFGDILGGFLETRAVSMVAGAQRSEAQAVLGVRSRLFDIFEPALWVGMPIGSLYEVTGPQVGLELRLTWDVRSVVEFGGRSRGSVEDL